MVLASSILMGSSPKDVQEFVEKSMEKHVELIIRTLARKKTTLIRNAVMDIKRNQDHQGK